MNNKLIVGFGLFAFFTSSEYSFADFPRRKLAPVVAYEESMSLDSTACLVRLCPGSTSVDDGCYTSGQDPWPNRTFSCKVNVFPVRFEELVTNGASMDRSLPEYGCVVSAKATSEGYFIAATSLDNSDLTFKRAKVCIDTVVQTWNNEGKKLARIVYAPTAP